MPERSCLNKTGPLEVDLMINANIGNNQLKINIITIAEKIISNKRFKNLLIKSVNGSSLNVITGTSFKSQY